MKDRKKRTLVIGILCCLLVFMGVGFAVMNATLNINGTATAINTWDVRMTNIEVIEKSDGATNEEETKINEDGISANFNTDFTKPGDYIRYKVTIENKGSIDAVLNDISITLNVSEADKDLFNITDTRPNNQLLEAGTSTTFTIKVEFRSDADRMPSGDIEYVVKVDYSQQTGEIVDSEDDWTVVVNDSGEIIAYNYNKGTNAVIPAEVDGVPVKTITKNSFAYKNIEFYQDASTGQVHSVIYEDEPNYSIVKDKALTLFAYQTCGSTACIPQIEAALTIYKPGDYTFPNGVTQSLYIDPDSNLDAFSSVVDDASPRITALDLSDAVHLTTIENKAFYRAYEGETKLESVIFPRSGNLTIGEQAFCHNNLSTITITPAIKAIGYAAFRQDSPFKGQKLQKVIFDENSNLTRIENDAFSNNELSGELKLPDSLIYLSGFSANPITKVTIPDNVETIGRMAFYHVSIENLQGIVFSNSGNLKVIEEDAFGSVGLNGELVIPEGVTTMGEGAFSNNKITKVILPSTLVELQDGSGQNTGAFAENDISEIVFATNSNLRKIGQGSFYGNKLESVTIPSSVTEIGSYAFYYQRVTLRSVIIKRTEQDFLANVTVGSNWYSNSSNLTITYDPS